LDRAWTLLVEQGYERTSLNALIEHAGVSKGTFYHYFSSKDEVVEAVVDRAIREAIADVTSLAGTTAVPALEKLNRFIGVAPSRPAATTALRRLFVQVRRAGAGTLLGSLRQHAVALCRPPLQHIIEQGIGEGVFSTPHPAEAAELLMLASDLALLDSAAHLLETSGGAEAERALLTRADFTVDAFERLLGIEHGVLDRMRPQDARAVVDAAAREEGRDGGRSR
jgi:AcrR family transcriptional regulator